MWLDIKRQGAQGQVHHDAGPQISDFQSGGPWTMLSVVNFKSRPPDVGHGDVRVTITESLQRLPTQSQESEDTALVASF